jgi:UDP-glucuronate decarboxylase
MNQGVIFDKKNILIIGGAGFIGSHLCDELIKNNKIICLDNFFSGTERNIDHLLADPNFEFIKHDISQPIEFEKFPELQKFKIQFQGIQEIYNLACPTSPKYFNENKINIIMANSYGTKNALDLAVKYNAKFLHFSSSVVYGSRPQDNEKIKENFFGSVDIMSERSAYDEGKRFAETLVKAYRDQYKIDAKIIRMFRVYGPRMKLNEGNMLPDFINNALNNIDLEIFGDNTFSSSFCYVNDIIDAVLKIMPSNLFGPINIGSDVEVNIVDLANKIINMTGSKSKIIFKESILFMTPLCLPDITKAKEELGWMPVISLEKGLEQTIYEIKASKGLVGVESIH